MTIEEIKFNHQIANTEYNGITEVIRKIKLGDSRNVDVIRQIIKYVYVERNRMKTEIKFNERAIYKYVYTDVHAMSKKLGNQF